MNSTQYLKAVLHCRFMILSVSSLKSDFALSFIRFKPNQVISVWLRFVSRLHLGLPGLIRGLALKLLFEPNFKSEQSM